MLNERKPGKTHFTEIEPLHQIAEAIIKQHEVEGLLELKFAEQVQKRHVRKYGERPAEIRSERQVSVAVQRDETAIQETVRRLGWRVYGTHHPQDELTPGTSCPGLSSRIPGRTQFWTTAGQTPQSDPDVPGR